MTSGAQIAVALAPPLFESWKPPLWPRTNHALERFIGRLKQSRRHITGRQHTQACILRDGTFVAIRFGLPQPDRWVEAGSRVNPEWHSVKPETESKSRIYRTVSIRIYYSLPFWLSLTECHSGQSPGFSSPPSSCAAHRYASNVLAGPS